jgi:hypothetical protein
LALKVKVSELTVDDQVLFGSPDEVFDEQDASLNNPEESK